jgi:hypothetical protein
MTEPVEISSYTGANAFFRAKRGLAGWATGLQVLMLTTTGAPFRSQ